MWGQGGGALQRLMGNGVWWRLGHGGCQRGVSAAGLRCGCGDGQQLLLWTRVGAHPPGQCGLQRERERAGPVPQPRLDCPQLLPLWGCGSHLQRWRFCSHRCLSPSLQTEPQPQSFFFVCALEPTLVGGRGLELQTPPSPDKSGLRKLYPLYFILH